MNFKLNLLEIIKQHSVFYRFLFSKNLTDLLFKQTNLKSGLVKINDDNEKYETNNVTNIKIIKKIIKAQIK